jgi:hypothetical protein
MFLTLRRWIAYAIWGTHAGAGKPGLRSATDTFLILRGDGVLVLAAKSAHLLRAPSLLPPDVIRSDWFELSGLPFAMNSAHGLAAAAPPIPCVLGEDGGTPLESGGCALDLSAKWLALRAYAASRRQPITRGGSPVQALWRPPVCLPKMSTLCDCPLSHQATANQDAGRT